MVFVCFEFQLNADKPGVVEYETDIGDSRK